MQEWNGMGPPQRRIATPNSKEPTQYQLPTTKYRLPRVYVRYSMYPVLYSRLYSDGIKSRPPPNETKVNFTTI